MPKSTPPTSLAEHRGQIRVVLAEDHDGMRHSLRLVLEGAGGISVIAEATDLVGALEQVLSLRPDVLVLDLSMRGGSSLELIEHMRHEQAGTEIVVVTMLESHAFARRASEVGARGFVVKDAADSELPVAVRRAARHARYLSPRVTEAVI
jgi:two-component system, NarL family, response regulator NreC